MFPSAHLRSGQTLIYTFVSYKDIFSEEERVTEVTMLVEVHPQPDGRTMFTYLMIGPQNRAT